jgi:integrase
VRRWAVPGWGLGRRGSLTAALKSDDSLLRVKRTGSKRRASVRDFHSFRVTWVTLALTAGVPLELVQKVTGHKTTDIVLKHYFQPGQEDFRLALQSAMPNLLTDGVLADGHRTPKEEMRELLATVRPVALRERLLKIWAKL